MVLLIIFIAPIAGRLSDRIGSRWLMGGGMTLLGISLLLYERVTVHSDFWTLLPPMLVGGFGMAMTMSPMTSAAMGAVPVDKAGVGSGVLNSFRQVGGSLGIALMGAIVGSYIHPNVQRLAAAQNYVTAPAGFEVGAAITFAAAIVAIVLVRTRPEVVARAHRGARGVSVAAPRMAAAERRLHLIETAIRLFTDGSYRGTTTAEIARAAGVSEPILYRHFASKRALYLAALEDVWAKTRADWEHKLDEAPDACAAIEAIGKGHVSVRSPRLQLAELWVQALSEAPEDPELKRHLRSHMREVHDFVAGLIVGGRSKERSPPSATPTRKRGSCSPAASSAWSADASASSMTGSWPGSAPHVSPGSADSATARSGPETTLSGPRSSVPSERSVSFASSRHEKAPAAAPGPSQEARHSWWGLRRRICGPSASFLHREFPGAPPANLGLASGLVARCAHYRWVRTTRQVARSSDFARRVVDPPFAMNTLKRGMSNVDILRFSEVCA